MSSSHPKARAGLLRHELDGQTVVYDPATEQVHLLDPSTGAALELLDGTRSREAIAAELTWRLGRPCDHELVALALDELAKADLLDADAASVTPLPDVARRDILKKLALTTAAVLIPTVLSVTPAGAQGSCTANGGSCTLSNPGACCGRFCCNNGGNPICASNGLACG